MVICDNWTDMKKDADVGASSFIIIPVGRMANFWINGMTSCGVKQVSFDLAGTLEKQEHFG